MDHCFISLSVPYTLYIVVASIYKLGFAGTSYLLLLSIIQGVGGGFS